MPVQPRLVPGPGVAPISCWASRAISANAFDSARIQLLSPSIGDQSPYDEARRSAGDLGCCQHVTSVARATRGYRPLVRLHSRRCTDGTIETWLEHAGFIEVRVTPKPESRRLRDCRSEQTGLTKDTHA